MKKVLSVLPHWYLDDAGLEVIAHVDMGPPSIARTVAIVFFAEGFMVDENPEKYKEEAEEEPEQVASEVTNAMFSFPSFR